MEALIFCSRRFKPDLGVPFRGYARRRIHEAATEAARKSRGWQKAETSQKQIERMAREVAIELLDIYPEIRSGMLPSSDEDDGEAPLRMNIRQLLIGAALLSSKQGFQAENAEDRLDAKKSIEILAYLEIVHQLILWRIYWESESMRGIASSWDTDELNVIREHKAILEYMQRAMETGKRTAPLRVRPGLKTISLQLKKKTKIGPFAKLVQGDDVYA